MRCVVFAYQDVGYVCLRELLQAGAEICAVVTHADDPGEEIWFRSVRELAENHSLPVFIAEDVNQPQWIERLRDYAPDFLFSFYYRKLLGNELLRLPKLGALNLHGSLLPKYRGRAPVNWAILHGERETGVTLHYMVEKPDRGDVVAQKAVPIAETDTAHSVYAKLTEAAAQLLRETYPLLCSGQAPRVPQDHSRATYFGGRGPQDGVIHWQRTARQVYNLVRALTHPYPGAFTHWQGRKLIIWEAKVASETVADHAPATIIATQPVLRVQCGEGLLEVRSVELEGEAEMAGPQWAEESGVRQGEQLG